MKIPFLEIHILKTDTLNDTIDHVSRDRAIALRKQNAELMEQNIALAHRINRLMQRGNARKRL